MFVDVREKLHPNLIKTSMLLVAERSFNVSSEVYKTIKKLKLNSESDVFSETLVALKEQGVDETAIKNLFTDSCSLILSLENPMYVLAEYIHSKEVRMDIKKKINSFNNNKNNYNLDEILNNFKAHFIAYSLESYDLDSDGLFKYICYSYENHFSKDSRYTKGILDVLNRRGTVVRGEEGSMSLTDKLGFDDESTISYEIDFPSIVKDITFASEALFKISGEIIFDLYSFYLEESLKSKSKDVRDLFKNSFGSSELSPVIIEKKETFEKGYRKNTMRKMYLITKRIYKAVESGLFSGNVDALYADARAIDMEIMNSNVPNLFSYPKPNDSYYKIETIDKSNRELFLTVLKGVVSLKEFVKYLTLNKIEFTDYNLFRDKDNYKRYSTLESYISMNKISKELIVESKENEVMLPYYENDKLYDVLSGRFNLSSLHSIYNEHFSRIYSDQDPSKKYLEDLDVLIGVSLQAKTEIDNLIEGFKAVELDPSLSEAFDYAVSTSSVIVSHFELFFNSSSPNYYLKDVLLETKDIYNLLRFFEFSLVIFDHLKSLLELTRLPNYKLMFSNNLKYLDFPKEITSVEDLSKIKSDRFELSFYREESSQYVDSYYTVSKFYSALFGIIEDFISETVEYTSNWTSKFLKTLNEYGIVVAKSIGFGSVKLRSKLVTLEGLDENLTKNFLEFSNKFSKINGLLSENGKPIIYNKHLVHEKGYFLSTISDFSISTITEMQSFDLNKVEPWRDVLWKV